MAETPAPPASPALWEQFPEESDLWYSRFERYRLMGPTRSMLGCVHLEEAEKSREKPSASVPGAWNDAAAKWNWKQRVHAFDLFQIDEGRRASRDELQGIRRETLVIAQEMRKKALAALKVVPAGDLPPREIRAWFNDSLAMELQARGLPASLLARPEAQDLEDSIALYRAVIRSPSASTSERLRARERLDKLLGLEATGEEDPVDDYWQGLLGRVESRVESREGGEPCPHEQAEAPS